MELVETSWKNPRPSANGLAFIHARASLFAWLLVGGTVLIPDSRMQAAESEGPGKPRVIILTDIGGDPDDQQSMVRFLVYANEFDVEGLIATTSGWKRDRVSPEAIRERLDAYAQVRPNLLRHAPGYPTTESLMRVTKAGRAASGMAAVGEGKDSEGSNHIITVVDKPDPRPVWICIWGGSNDLAQALFDVKMTRSEEEVRAFMARLRIYDLAGQDDTGAWICHTFPDIFWIRSQNQWRGISHRIDAKRWKETRGGNESLMAPDWLARNIQNHGPLGELYPNTKYLTEGDTPTLLHLLPTGLADPELIHFGNWGGRFGLQRKRNCRGVSVVKTEGAYDDYSMYTGAKDTWTYGENTYAENLFAPIFRWREAFQHDFAARMDWSVTGSYGEANHNPIAVCQADKSTNVVVRSVTSGKEVKLSAAGSSDPDGDELFYHWWQYREPGTYEGAIQIDNRRQCEASLTAPKVSVPRTIHIVLTVRDDGSPNLYSYRRIVLAVMPEKRISTTESTEVSYLKRHFGEQYFLPKGGFVLRRGQELPDMVWENPALVATVLDDLRIPTRWFDDDFAEVKTAHRLGRYYAYGEAPAAEGPPLRRAMTCYCIEADQDLARLVEELNPSIRYESEPKHKRDLIANTVQAWCGSEEGAVTLAAIMEAGPEHGCVRVGQWQMENASRHVRLKRKLMGLENKAPVIVEARPNPGKPAPVLRAGSLEQARIEPQRVREVAAKLDDWYASTLEPTAIVIARHGVIVLARSYGELGGQPVSIDTPMLLHSAMKPLMGLQLAMYVDRGLVQLDEPIGNYLPDFDTARDRNLTFRAGHVHVSGIHFPWPLAFSRLFYFRTWQESLIAHCPREWAPGAKRRYGVVGIILAVRALELMSGKNYWHAMENELFAPLGIENVLPGGTGFSAENLARIGVLLANRGRYGTWELFSEETYQSILPVSLTPYFPEVDAQWGIGLQNAAERLGPGSYGHGGGCGTQLLVNPDKHLVFAMVRNAQGKEYKQHLAEVLAMVREL